MGCGASKGKDEGGNTEGEITFKLPPLHECGSLYAFFNGAQELISNYYGVTSPLGDYKNAFMDATGFVEVPGA